MVFEVNLLVHRFPAMLRPPSSQPAARVSIARELRPLDVRKMPIGPRSSRFMDRVNSKETACAPSVLATGELRPRGSRGTAHSH